MQQAEEDLEQAHWRGDEGEGSALRQVRRKAVQSVGGQTSELSEVVPFFGVAQTRHGAGRSIGLRVQRLRHPCPGLFSRLFSH